MKTFYKCNLQRSWRVKGAALWVILLLMPIRSVYAQQQSHIYLPQVADAPKVKLASNGSRAIGHGSTINKSLSRKLPRHRSRKLNALRRSEIFSRLAGFVVPPAPSATSSVDLGGSS